MATAATSININDERNNQNDVVIVVVVWTTPSTIMRVIVK
jgi:hypothetical protein